MSEESEDDMEFVQQYLDHFDMDYDHTIEQPLTIRDIRILIKEKNFNVNKGSVGWIYDMKFEHYLFLTDEEKTIIDKISFETNIGSSDIICKEAFYKLKAIYNDAQGPSGRL